MGLGPQRGLGPDRAGRLREPVAPYTFRTTQRGLAALSVMCFALVVMAWYGVNFVMGAGLHTYGFGESSGQSYVAGILIAQFVYIFIALVRSQPNE